ncbi:aldehyde dehydrogenase family protein [Natrononativus amylolyticus]|uniref:2,5-dioxovalerate dehydrogenase n=1 Tax=Natrononativus amylolyticus TaxID=2963434 RepID=UPI0020CFB6D3|nr:aldehyde dehydrogenase family protein [Natrononativus amylolyticus]
MSETRGNFIGGEWTDSESNEAFVVRNPADPSDEVASFPQSSADDVDRAVEAASDAAGAWADTPASERGAVLSRTARELEARTDELAETLVREEGKARPEAAGEVGRAADIFEYYAAKTRDLGGVVKSSSSSGQRLYTVAEPLGVTALITPWNYPIAIPAWKLAPALAAGNTAVLKPATLAPEIGRLLIECLEEAGVPDGVVNYVTGSGSEVGDALVSHEDVDAVSFTGSARVGDAVYQRAAEDQKRVQLEMGGKNPTIVSESADVEEAAEIVATGAFGVTGQACTACSRAIVHESVHDAFLEAVVERAEAIDVGPGLEGGEMGPQVSEDELESTLEYVDVAKREGATLETGGGRPEDEQCESGYFVEPTVFSDVDPEMRIAQEEVFGPVLSVLTVSDFEEAVAVANDVEYGLSASIVTNDHAEANRFVDDVEAGVVKVNQKTTGLELHVPFGGMKASSSETYREQGDAGLDFYTITKTVYDSY